MKSLPLIPVTGKQRGVVLFIALIVLVAMTLAGIAVMRSVGTNVLIAGNVAFKQVATSGADYGVEAARAWITAASDITLQTDSPGSGANGYYSSWMSDPVNPGDPAKSFNPFNFDWDANAKLFNPDPSTKVQYVIHRMCLSPNTSLDDAAQQCVVVEASGALGSTQNVLSAGGGGIPSKTQTYYRVTVRVVGPKNTTSYVQTVLN